MRVTTFRHCGCGRVVDYLIFHNGLPHCFACLKYADPPHAGYWNRGLFYPETPREHVSTIEVDEPKGRNT